MYTCSSSVLDGVLVWVLLCTVGESGMWGLGSPPLTTTAISVTSHQSVSKAFLTLPSSPSLPPSLLCSFFVLEWPHLCRCTRVVYITQYVCPVSTAGVSGLGPFICVSFVLVYSILLA